MKRRQKCFAILAMCMALGVPALAQKKDSIPDAGAAADPQSSKAGKTSKVDAITFKQKAAETLFSERDREIINRCSTENKGAFPPGLAKREKLPPGLERQLRRNGTLPPGLQKKVQPLPGVCNQQLPKLPAGIERVIYGGRVILVNQSKKILDIFMLVQG